LKEITFQPIGIIHSPFKRPEGTPIQFVGGKNIRGTIEIFPQYVEGLKDLEGFSHIFLIYYLNRVSKRSLVVKPYMDDKLRGVFATRSPSRPNHIGLSIVRLIKISKNQLEIQDLDILDATPLLDIKPYVPEVDTRENCKIGWMKDKVGKFKSTLADKRFHAP